MATAGPMPMMSGGTPATAKLTKRAMGFKPSSRAIDSAITSATAAPSDIATNCRQSPYP
jgi:hypothetical protein